MKRIAVFGGRDLRCSVQIRSALDGVLAKHGPFIVVHGACPTGADKIASQWARWRGLPEEPHPADWQVHGRRAGPLRNEVMARSGLDGAVAFPGGRGTADMLKRCVAAGVPVWRPAIRPLKETA